MRVTSNMLYNGATTGLQNRFSEMKTVQEEASTGNRVRTPSDNALAAFMDMLLSNNQSEVDSRVSNLQVATQRLTVGEEKMQIVEGTFVDAYEIAMSMANDYQSPEDLRIQGEVLTAYYEDMLVESNTNVDGVPVFSGGRTVVPFDESIPDATDVSIREAGTGDLTRLNATQNYITNLDSSVAGFPGVPASIKVSYIQADGAYRVQVDDQTPVDVVDPGNYPGDVELGWGTMHLENPPTTDGTQYFFEMVPSYVGSTEERAIQVKGTRTIPGNVTGDALFQGVGGEEIDLFGAIIGLRGALKRADHGEVSKRIEVLTGARGQVSRMLSLTGLRGKRLDTAIVALNQESSSIQEARALNKEADLLDVLSRLQKTTQAMQITTLSERSVLNTSLLDFLK